MTDVRLKDPKTDYVVVVGSAIEAANLRAAGYTDVDEESTDLATPDSVAKAESVDDTATSRTGGTEGGDTPAQTGTETQTDPATAEKPPTPPVRRR